MRPTSELKATSVREMQRPDVQSRMRYGFKIRPEPVFGLKPIGKFRSSHEIYNPR